MNINKITILMGVAGLVYGTSSNAFYNVNADLPRPTYDLAYGYTGNPSGAPYWFLSDGTDTSYDIAYNRTADGIYFNYSNTFNNSLSGFEYIPDGLDITMTFNRSNSGWISTGTGLYFPDSGPIGSDNSVGTISKLQLTFTNNTENNYRLYFDNSSTGSFSTNWIYDLEYDGIKIANDIYTSTSFLTSYIIPSNFTFSMKSRSHNSQNYFDAWYLKVFSTVEGYVEGYDDGYADGVGDGYEDGYDNGLDDGYTDGANDMVLSGGFTGFVQTIFDTIGSIFAINIFTGITLGTIALFPLLAMILFFFKKFIQ
jgi:hypothetical protein